MTTARQNANSLRRAIRVWYKLSNNLTNGYNGLTAEERNRLRNKLARGETNIRLRARNAARRHGLQLNGGHALGRIVTRLITQLEMISGGLPIELVNRYTTPRHGF